MRQIEKYRQSARIELGREPTLQEIELAFKHIKTQLKVKASWLAQAQAGSRPEISLSAQREHRSDTSTAGAELLVDKALPPEEQVLAEMTQESLVNDIRRALRETLEERELQIIEARFGFNGLPVKTLNELGTEFEITKEGIRQVQLKALAKLKASSLLKRYQDL
jgi:DNA-directed RNA polymerase sigma subunit (sigma70/sigma32)